MNLVRKALLVSLTLALLMTAATVSRLADPAYAHPLGEFTVNHFSEVEFTRDSVRIEYVVDYAELSTLEQIRRIDGAHGDELEESDLERYLDELVPQLLEGLDLEIDGTPVALGVESTDAEILPGNWGLQLLRIELVAVGELPITLDEEPVEGRYVVRNYPGRLGWHEVVMPPGQDVTIEQTDALRESASAKLREYPDAGEQDPLQIYDVTFTLSAGAVDPPADDSGDKAAPGGESQPSDPGLLQRLTSATERLVNLEGAAPTAMMLTMVGAFVWGALHALSPGHGKAVVGAYLIGSRGTARHAAFLGVTVTATHTAGIFALGFVTLALSHLILPESLFPWLSLTSGILVIMIGVSIGYRRWMAYRTTGVADDHGHYHHNNHSGHEHHHHHDQLHDHHHHHHYEHGPAHHRYDHGHERAHHGRSHLPPGGSGSDVTWRSLLALGISGGIVPCPSALILLLGAISLGRLEFGLVLVVLFSLGLAAVLTMIGMLMVYMRSIFDRFAFETRAPGVLPIASSAAIALAGAIIVVGAVSQTGLV